METETAVTIPRDLKRIVEQAGREPIRIQDPETHTAYLLVREDVYRKLWEQAAIDHADRSLYEFGEFVPDPE
jgi:hypothetical protein